MPQLKGCSNRAVWLGFQKGVGVVKNIPTTLFAFFLIWFACCSRSTAQVSSALVYVSGGGSNSNNGQSTATPKATIGGATGALSVCPAAGCSVYQLSPTAESSIVISQANIAINFAPGVTTISGNIEMLNNNISLIGYGDDTDQESTTGTILRMSGAPSGTQGGIVAARDSLSPTRAIMRPRVEGLFIKGSGSEGGLDSAYSSCVMLIGSWHGVIERNHCLGSDTANTAAFLLQDVYVSASQTVGSYYNEIRHNTCRYMAKCIELNSVGTGGVNQNHITFNSGSSDAVGIEYTGTGVEWNTSEGNDISSASDGWIGFYMTGATVYNLSIDDALELGTGSSTLGLYLDSGVAGNIFIHPHFDNVATPVADKSVSQDTVFIGNPANTQGPSLLATQSVLLSGGLAFHTISKLTPDNGTERYCTDCKNVPDGAVAGNACVGGGSGSIAKRLDGKWLCN